MTLVWSLGQAKVTEGDWEAERLAPVQEAGLQQILAYFEGVFREPQGPPETKIDHRITLKEDRLQIQINSMQFVRAMEVLYTKLHDKYTEVKTKKLSDLEHLNEEQQLKFINCLSAAEEVIEHLKTEKEELLGQVNDLRVELASLRAAKDNQLADYQMLLMEESHKNKALSEEVEKLQQLRQEGASHDLNNSSRIIAVDDQFKDNSNRSSVRMTRKRKKQNALKDEARFISFENDQVNSVERESMHNACKETASGTPLECCSEANVQSGIDLQETGHGDRLIPVLFEYALGMKFSTYCQTGRICLSALHLSSGYSFSLSWICKAPEEEAELMYHVLSLGTFERVAPEWMKEDIVFSPSMCPIFFERVSRVIKLNH